MSPAGPASFRIFVVSMDTAVERRRRFAERAAETSLPWAFMSARTELHPALIYREADAVVGCGRPLHRGEIGCYSSHYALWEQLLADDVDQYVVLEDDVIVDWTFLSMLAPRRIGDWSMDYLRLYYKSPCGQSVLKHNFVEESHTLVELHGLALGTQGYVIGKSGAAKFVEHCRRVRRPVDVEMDRSWAHGVRNLSVFPFPILEAAVDSGIGPNRYERPDPSLGLKWRRRVGRRLERAWMQASTAAGAARARFESGPLGSLLGVRRPDYL